jgi:hypothetical protein
MPVWDRLCADAAVRRTLPRNRPPAPPPRGPCAFGGGCFDEPLTTRTAAAVAEPAARAPAGGGAGSGFVTNNSSGRAAARERRLSERQEAQLPGLDALHAITLQRYKKVSLAACSASGNRGWRCSRMHACVGACFGL